MHIVSSAINPAVVFASLLIFNAGASQARWRPEYAKADPRIAAYFEYAQSKRGGNCCKWADGYILGKEYPNIYSSGDRQYHTIIVFLKWESRPDGYHATILDVKPIDILTYAPIMMHPPPVILLVCLLSGYGTILSLPKLRYVAMATAPVRNDPLISQI